MICFEKTKVSARNYIVDFIAIFIPTTQVQVVTYSHLAALVQHTAVQPGKYQQQF